MGREAVTYRECEKVEIPATYEDEDEDEMVISCRMLTGLVQKNP